MFDENTPGAKEELFAWLRHMNKYKGSDLFITTNFPPAMKVDGKIMRLTDEPLSAEKMYGNRFFDYVFQTNRRIFYHQRMQFRHQPARYQPLPCQCNGSTRRNCISVPLNYQQYP